MKAILFSIQGMMGETGRPGADGPEGPKVREDGKRGF